MSEDTVKDSYTKEEVEQIVMQARVDQARADMVRVHGNAFFAEALDHISQLSARDKFWKEVYAAGLLFKQQFEMNTGQVQQQAPAQEKKAKAKETAEDGG